MVRSRGSSPWGFRRSRLSYSWNPVNDTVRRAVAYGSVSIITFSVYGAGDSGVQPEQGFGTIMFRDHAEVPGGHDAGEPRFTRWPLGVPLHRVAHAVPNGTGSAMNPIAVFQPHPPVGLVLR